MTNAAPGTGAFLEFVANYFKIELKELVNFTAGLSGSAINNTAQYLHFPR